MKQITIAGKKYSYEKPLIVAELGASYYSEKTTIKMIKAASDSGVDAVKFQTYNAENIALPGKKFQYSDGKTQDQFKFFKKWELSPRLHFIYQKEAHKNGLIFFSSACDWPSLKFLVNDIKVPAIKIASQDCTNYPFLKDAGKTNLPIILSTGIATMEEVIKAVKIIEGTGNKKITITHCVVDYPSDVKNLNLNIIDTYKIHFPYLIGFSDHSKGIIGPATAVAKGITYYERHFILPGQKGPDSKVASTSKEFKTIINIINQVIKAKGSQKKKIFPSEKRWLLARKKIVLISDKIRGEIINRKDLDIRRSEKGIEPKYFDYVIGKKVKNNIKGIRGLLKSDLEL